MEIPRTLAKNRPPAEVLLSVITITAPVSATVSWLVAACAMYASAAPGWNAVTSPVAVSMV